MPNSLLPFLLAGIASVTALAQDDKPSREARAKERAQKLEQATARLARLAEKYSQLSFLEPPVVEAKTHAEWRRMVEEEFLPDGSVRDVMELAMTLVGVYLPDPPRVVLSPVVVGPMIAKPRKEESRMAFERRVQNEATIVHELVHALQDQHYRLPRLLHAAEDDEEILLYKGLIEGHAVFVEERVAETEWKFEDFMDRGPYRSLGSDPSYHYGHRYFNHVFREHGMKGVLDKLANPPTYQAFLELASKPLPELPPKEEGGDKPKIRPAGGGASKK